MTRDNFPTEQTIREYLLGKLDGQPELESQLSQQMLSDDELSEIVDSIEDEIIEDYLDDTVVPTDRRAIEEYFLRPAERRQKLHLARLLRNHFQAPGSVLEKKKTYIPLGSIPNEKSPGMLPFSQQSHFRTYLEVSAAVLLIVMGLAYTSSLRHRLQSQLDASNKYQIEIKNELAQARDRYATLEKELQEARPALLTFLGPIFRDNARVPVIEIRPWTKQVKVEIGIPRASGNYDVRLNIAAGKEVWSRTITAASDGLRFELPARVIAEGNYCFVVSSQPEPYCFQAKIIQ
jgi:hypothetical protein